MIDESFEFASQLFYSRDRWLHAIAESWLTGNGENDRNEINDWLNKTLPTDFAAECLDCWFTEFADQMPDLEELADKFADLAKDRTWLNEVYSKASRSAL